MQQGGAHDVSTAVNQLAACAAMDDLDAFGGGASTETRPVPVPAAPTSEVVARIYDQHQAELFGFALRATRDREVAEDLVHESFIRLIVEIEAGRGPSNPRAWLFRVVANLAISRGRRAVVAQRQLGALVDRGAATGPEPLYLEHERRSDLETLLGELGTDARTALLMAANGFSGVEIADAIGRTDSATRTLMCRARLHLRQRLGSLEAFA